MNDPAKMTILTCCSEPRLRASKRFRLVDGKVESDDYRCGIRFEHREIVVGDLQELCAELERLASGTQGECFVVRGKVKPEHQDKSHIFRRYTDPDPATNHLTDVPQSWAAFDLDGWPLPEGLDVVHQTQCAFIWARGLLASSAGDLATDLTDAGFVWQASNSCGVKPGLRGKLWVLLVKPITCAELRRWCKAVNRKLRDAHHSAEFRLDEMQCAPTQPIYIRNPKFVPPLTDPMSKRWSVVPGPRALLVPPLVPARPRRLFMGRSNRKHSGSDWANVLCDLGDGGWRAVISRAIHRGVADGVAPDEIKRAIRAAAAGRRSIHGAQYDERVLDERHLDDLIAHAQALELAAEAAEFELLRILNRSDNDTE